MNAHSLSFSVADSAGNLLKTKTFNEFNLLLSRHCLPWEPSVLLFMISSFVKKKGRRLTAHLCLFTSFWSASRTRCTFLGVTHVRITSSATGISTALSTALLELTVLVRVAGVGSAGVSTVGTAGVSSVGTVDVSTVGTSEVSSVGTADVSSVGTAGAAGAGKCTERLVSTSALKLSKVSMSIVDRSWRGGTLADKLTDNGSMFSGFGYCEKKKSEQKNYKNNKKKYNTDFLYSTQTVTVKQPLFLRFTKLITLYNLRWKFTKRISG